MRAIDKPWLYTDGPMGVGNFRQQLGRSVELGRGTPAGLKQTLVYTGATQRTQDGDRRAGLAGRAPGDSAASIMQVSCTYRGSSTENTANPLVIRGRIDFGTDGHQASAYFDWLNGTIIQVAASFVQVVAQVVPAYYGVADEEPTFDNEARVTVGATVALGAANRPAPTLTQQVRMAAVGVTPDSVALVIPRFARKLWWLGPLPSSAQWAAGPATAQALGEVDPLGMSQRQPYERPGVASHLLLTSALGLPTLNALVWELCL